jgi:thiamine biosynthesis protein ThiS
MSSELERLRPLPKHLADIGEGLAAIDARLACTEQIEVGAVEDKHGIGHLRRGVDLPICRLSMTLDGSLSIRVNGEHRRVPEGTSIAAMVNSLGLDPLRVAVERNLAIVTRSELGRVCVEDGDDYEIVHFVGGG